MNVDEYEKNEVTVVALEGKFDAVAAAQVETRFQNLLDSGVKRVVIDFSEVPYISSAGLRVLLVLVKGLQRGGGELRLANLQPAVQEVMDTAGFTPFLEICERVEDALGSF